MASDPQTTLTLTTPARPHSLVVLSVNCPAKFITMPAGWTQMGADATAGVLSAWQAPSSALIDNGVTFAGPAVLQALLQEVEFVRQDL